MLNALGFSAFYIFFGGAVRSFEEYIVDQIVIHSSSYRFESPFILRVTHLLSLVYLKPCRAFHIKIRQKYNAVMPYESFVLAACYLSEHACCSYLQRLSHVIS